GGSPVDSSGGSGLVGGAGGAGSPAAAASGVDPAPVSTSTSVARPPGSASFPSPDAATAPALATRDAAALATIPPTSVAASRDDPAKKQDKAGDAGGRDDSADAYGA
ncbi:unnamed protein product, partial [Ectocarpus sp. 8 AP-2014]